MVPQGEDEIEKTSIVSTGTFTGRVKAADDTPPALIVLVGPPGYVGRQFPLTTSEVTLGRSIDSHIYIDDKSVSRSHARFIVNGTEVTVADMGSANKTVINEKTTLAPMTPYRLQNDDRIKTGSVILKFLEKGSLETLANKELNEKALKDGLTGAFSKGALLEKGPEAMKRSEFLTEDLSVLIFDIDFFKKINDTHGHSAGDYVLKELSRIVGQKMIRGNDYFARYGGEEFVILLPAAGAKTALEVAERIRTTIESAEFNYEGTKIPVTISVGIATRKLEETSWDVLLDRADQALYQSKHSGRNRVTVSA
ncbi:MAG: diguanylate cyclase [Pseudobdellovibrionaceae bacterium]|jgi:two-component system cell cycle response regulator